MKKGFTLIETLLVISISVSLILAGYMIVKRTIITYQKIEQYQDEVFNELKAYYKVTNYFRVGEIQSIDYNRGYYDSDYFIIRADFPTVDKEMKIVFNDAIYLKDERLDFIPTRVVTNGATLLIYVKDDVGNNIICIRGINI